MSEKVLCDGKRKKKKNGKMEWTKLSRIYKTNGNKVKEIK
jgi:hypothetical protein